MGEGASELDELVAEELFRAAPDAAQRVSDAIRLRFGDAVAAVVFYGSCLRKRSDEGVLDFYVLVDSYRAAYRSRALAWANAALPPNVFYVEVGTGPAPLRAKYAVMSSRDFERAAGPGNLRPGIWARFCQPAAAVYVRDESTRSLLVRAASAAIRTAVAQIVPLLPARNGTRRFTSTELWQRVFVETYATEMRPESPEAAAGLVDADRDRFARAARGGLAALALEPGLEVRSDGDALEVRLHEPRARLTARSWRLRRLPAKLVYLIALGKSALTFGDWLPYVLWKLERHTGTRIEPSDRQRRHPLIWGWPLLFRVLWRRELR